MCSKCKLVCYWVALKSSTYCGIYWRIKIVFKLYLCVFHSWIVLLLSYLKGSTSLILLTSNNNQRKSLQWSNSVKRFVLICVHKCMFLILSNFCIICILKFLERFWFAWQILFHFHVKCIQCLWNLFIKCVSSFVSSPLVKIVYSSQFLRSHVKDYVFAVYVILLHLV